MTSKKMRRMYGPKKQQAAGDRPELTDIGVEAEVLAILMSNDKAYYEAHEELEADAFSDEAYAAIYAAWERLYREKKPRDIAQLQHELDAAGASVQMEDIAIELQANTVTEESVRHYATYLQQLAFRRGLRAFLLEVIPKIESDEQDIAQIFVEIVGGMYALRHNNQEKHLHAFKEMLARARQEMEDRRDGKEPNKGTMSGYPSLDEVTLGFRPGELTLIAGNTGHGKTTLAINILTHMLLVEKKRIAVFSLEMGNNKLFTRMVRSLFEEAVVTKDGVKMTDKQWGIVETTLKRLESEEYPLFIDDTPSMHVDDMRSKMLYLVKHHGVSEVIVDYSQLMDGEGSNRQEEVAYVVQALRAMAKEFQVAIIALAQFNRSDVREQVLRMPKLHNMRESGSLEMTADIVLSIMRPELTIDGLSIGGIPLKNRAILSVLKNREGDRKHIDMIFDGPRTKFMELPQGVPSLVNAVLKTGGRADVENASSSSYVSIGSSTPSQTAPQPSGQEKLPEIKRQKYVDDDI